MKLDKINIVDVEATCWEGDPPLDQTSEIISIGICPLGFPELVVEEARSVEIIVRPCASEVSTFCTELTGLTSKEVRQGVSLEEACNRIRKKFGTRNQAWASFGDYDRTMFERCCDREWYPFGPRHINVKTWASLALGRSKGMGTGRALQTLTGRAFKGTQHNARWDAINIAFVLSEIIRRLQEGPSYSTREATEKAKEKNDGTK